MLRSAAKWSQRLPRTSTRAASSRSARRSKQLVEQSRWAVKPSSPGRPPASRSAVSRATPTPQNDQQRRVGPPKQGEPQTGRNAQLAETLAQSDTSDLVTEVHIPNDPHGIVARDHPALSILGNSSLVIQRQLELMNVMLGFEQANKYIIMDGQGQTLGYIAEQDHGIGSAIARQAFRTHRSFTTHIFDAQQREVLRIHRPFAYINSRIRIYDPVPPGGYENVQTSTALRDTSTTSASDLGAATHTSPLKLDEMRIIGEAQQQWAPLRRKYNLFTFRPFEENESMLRLESGRQLSSANTALTEDRVADEAIESGMVQFAHVNEPFLSWDFTLRDVSANTIGSVNRNFGGFAREIFTDTGVYALRMDSAAQTAALESADGHELQRYEKDATAMTLDQRAVMLATAVSIDFDYFSRHSGHTSGGFMPFFWPMGGASAEGAGAAGAGAAGGAAAGEAGAAGVGTAVGSAEGMGAIGSAAGRGITGAGAATESGIAGAGTMAGYEAMQRGVYGSAQGYAHDASPQANEPFQGAIGDQAENRPGNDEVWGESSDPWRGSGPGDGSSPSTGGGGEGGWLDSISDFFGSS